MLRLLAVSSVCAALAACNCAQPPPKEGQRDLGASCESDAQCKSGLCDHLPGVTTGNTCLKPCAGGCDQTEVCVSLGLGHFACGPEKEGLCRACNTDNDCPYPEDRCLLVGAARECGRDCSFDGVCPAGYVCGNGLTPDGNQVFAQCQPGSGTCGCTPATFGQVVPCQRDNTFGHCMGMQTCMGTAYGECSARVPSVEICNGLDDDCDGTTDQMGSTSCGVGECRVTTELCIAGQTQTCTPGAPTAEICDEKDNDCDGVEDNGFDKMSSINNCGRCNFSCVVANGTPKCATGTCAIASCNPGFGDCNTMYDDGCETNTQTSVMNCGMCGQACNRANSNNSCVGGTCLSTCLPGWVDLNGLPGDGCEYACTQTSTTDLPDLGFVDANCDGIDGELGNAVFVSMSGNDANAGDKANPKRNLAAALAAAVSGNKRDVYVAAGTWLEQLQVPAGKGIYGGYLDGTWVRSTFNVATVTGVNTPLLISNANNATVQLMTFLGSTPVGNSQTAYGAQVLSSIGVNLEGVTIRAGNGTGGLAGASGGSGAQGGAGQIGQPGVENSSFPGCSGGNQPQGGAGGVNTTCGRTGGRGGNPNDGSGNGNGGSPGVGFTAGGQGSGGAAGMPSGLGDWVPGSPWVGVAGSPGATGAGGTSAGSFGSVSAGGYVVAVASGGQSGVDGNGGGGGASGGGGTNFCDSYGGAGAGGGAGGCQGGGGTAGSSGGASVALFISSARVTATQCILQTGNGGNGGNGGAGGVGGLGGAGGVAPNGAGNVYGGSSQQDDGSNGARGGAGGKGGNGGAGGAGGGGPSIGVMVTGASAYSSSTTTVSLGSPGAGGTSAAGNGANGLAANVYP